MTIKSIFTLLILMFSIPNYVHGQGCSDAGFCTINNFKPDETDSISIHYENQFKLGISYGRADNAISVIANYFEYHRTFNNNFSADVKLTSISQSGNGISSFGISDIFLNTNYSFSEKIKITLGAKIPLHDANRKENGISVPMDYQSSLGTVDLIAGFGYEINKFQIVIALQQPVTQNNNEFFAENYPLNSELRKFQSTNKFKRSGDILLRISYPFELEHTVKITPSILPIYHLTNDIYTTVRGVENEIQGSNGLTFNANAYVDYIVSDNSAVQLNVGLPFIVRKVRADGLTRSVIATVEYRVKF